VATILVKEHKGGQQTADDYQQHEYDNEFDEQW
jgi:hypothetical protein